MSNEKKQAGYEHGFANGVLYASQLLAITLKDQNSAKYILRESGIDQEELIEIQLETGFYDHEMMDLINSI